MISTLEEEIRSIDNKKNIVIKAYRIACEKEKRTSSELSSVSANVTKLHAIQNQYKSLINDLKDKIEANEAISITVFVSYIYIIYLNNIYLNIIYIYIFKYIHILIINILILNNFFLILYIFYIRKMN